MERYEDLQKKGMVYVFYNYTNLLRDLSYMKDVYKLERSLPWRVIAVHYCYLSEELRPFVSGLHAFFNPRDRFRFRQHLGSSPEGIEFELQTFGIPTWASPMQPDGTWLSAWHREWLETHRIREEREDALSVSLANPVSRVGSETTDDNDSVVVGRFDVTLGKSTKAREHTGSRRASHLCEMFYDQYQRANKYQKTEIAERIVQMIRESGGRFIREENDEWVEVDDMVARAKIAHFFRYKRSKKQQDEEKRLDGSESENVTTC